MSSGYTPYPQSPDVGGMPAGEQGYLHGGPTGFGQAISEAFKNVFTYNGRASQGAYWWFFLFAIIVSAVFAGIGFALKPYGFVLMGLWYVVVFFTTLSLAVRRLHDSDRSGFWYFINLVPIIGGIWFLVLLIVGGTQGPNKYDAYQ